MNTMKSQALAAVAVWVVALSVSAPAARGASTEDRKPVPNSSLVAAPTGPEEGAQADDHLFDSVEKLGAKAKESSEVNLDKSMLALAAHKGGEKGELAQKLDYIVVRNYEFARENDYNMDDLKAVFKKLDEGGWKHLVRTREQKEMTDICVRQDSEGVTKEMVIISAEPKELSLIHLKGNVSLGDMKNFGGLVNGATRGDSQKDGPKLERH